MYFIIAGNIVRSPTGCSSNYTGLRVVAKCQSLDEVEKQIGDIYDESGGLVLVIDEEGNEQGHDDTGKTA